MPAAPASSPEASTGRRAARTAAPARMAPITAGIPPPAAAANAPIAAATPPASQMKPGPTIRHQATSEAPAAIPPDHMASTSAGDSSTRQTVDGRPTATLTGVSDDWPTVSIVIPVRNEAGTVGEAVVSALAQDYPGELEVVVADGESTDGTGAVLDRLAASDRRLRVVPNPAGTTPAGLNTAIRASIGEVRGALRCPLRAPSRLPHSGGVHPQRDRCRQRGRGAAGHRGDPVAAGHRHRHVDPDGVGDARFHHGGAPGPVDTVYLGVFRREVLDRVGMFDETLLRNQDYELNWRIQLAGGVIWFDPRLQVRYAVRPGLAALWTQYFDYGRWKREMLRRHPGSLRPRQMAPPLLVGGLAGSALLVLAGRRRAAGLVPRVYAAALGTTAAYQLARRRDPAALLLPAALAVMHLAWGTGLRSAADRERAERRT